MGCVAFGLAACQRAIQPVTTVKPVVVVLPVSDTIIAVTDLIHTPILEMSKTPCFGSCPVFVVKIYANGEAHWQGIKNVARLGEYNATVPVSWMEEVLKIAENQGFYKMAHRYPSNGTTVPDLPQTMITLNTHERGRYSVVNIADAPLKLLQIERDFEQKLDMLEWKGVR